MNHPSGIFATLHLDDTTADERSGGVTLPTLFNPYEPQYIADPHAFFARLREVAPVQRARLPDGQVVWLLTGYADVEAASRRRDEVEKPALTNRRVGPRASDLSH